MPLPRVPGADDEGTFGLPMRLWRDILAEPAARKQRMTETVAEPTAKKWICQLCGLIYDPEEGDPDSGIPPGTPFEDIPDDWSCPICGAEKADFREMEPGEEF